MNSKYGNALLEQYQTDHLKLRILSFKGMCPTEEGDKYFNAKIIFPDTCSLPFSFFEQNKYRISSVIRQSVFLLKQSKRSRSVLKDGSRSLGLFRKGKIGIIAKFHRTDLVI